MTAALSVLIVDVSEAWEEELKAHERGYYCHFDHFTGQYGKGAILPETAELELAYPHGSLRAGFNAIIDVAALAHHLGIPRYAVHLYDSWSDGDYRTCQSLQPYVPRRNQYEKHRHNAFDNKKFAKRMATDEVRRLFVLGYDRDWCVLETIRGALAAGIEVATSEQCLLTKNLCNRREQSLEYLRKHTTYLETLADAMNFLTASSRRE